MPGHVQTYAQGTCAKERASCDCLIIVSTKMEVNGFV